MVAAALAVGLVAWAVTLVGGSPQAGVIAMWCFVGAAFCAGWLLPLPQALVAPLYMGIVGWLVDMLPLVVIAGWAGVAVRWAWGLLRERRLPRGGRWIWLPIGLVFWTSLGVLVIGSADFKHFLLLLGIQTLAGAVILACVDRLAAYEDRLKVVSGLVAFVVVLSVGVFFEWVGVPVEDLQDSITKVRVEAAYSLDAFPNSTGMIKYARAREAGANDLRNDLEEVADANPGLPPYEAFAPKFKAFENHLVVRFAGSARAWARELRAIDVELRYDNLGLRPANTVPRMRSFPRNALTYAGVCAAVFPLAVFLWWSRDRRRRMLGAAGAAACLFGAGFSLARGAWLAIFLGVAYIVIDGVVSKRKKVEVAAIFLAGALFLTGVYIVRYASDPLTARAGGTGSVGTRSQLYTDTIDSVSGIHFVIGFGTEKPRRDVAEGGGRQTFGRYVPVAGSHSTYLNYLFRTGVPGALMIMALYLVAGLHARAGARSFSGEESLLYSALAMSVIILGAHAVILSLFVEPTYSLTISLIVGLAVAG
ncbi:MAG TPA: O-antigen ligase family protein, partial [Actinomycetota bacterium]|nr:O-antigen ligase family protein [Actinomycetota bacterium]